MPTAFTRLNYRPQSFVEFTYRFEPDEGFIESEGNTDFSREIRIQVPQDNQTSTRLFFPIYYVPYGGSPQSFKGIEISQKLDSCITALYRVKDVNQFSLLLNLTLSPNWQQTALYQTLDRGQRSSIMLPRKLR